MKNINEITAFDDAVRRSFEQGQAALALHDKGDLAFNAAAVQYLAGEIERKIIEQARYLENQQFVKFSGAIKFFHETLESRLGSSLSSHPAFNVFNNSEMGSEGFKGRLHRGTTLEGLECLLRESTKQLSRVNPHLRVKYGFYYDNEPLGFEHKIYFVYAANGRFGLVNLHSKIELAVLTPIIILLGLAVYFTLQFFYNTYFR